VAVVVAVWQLWASRVQARTDFEDDLAREYRDLAQQLPVKAMLGERLKGEAFEDALPAFYRYMDLSNQQAFLRQNGRVSRSAWRNWADGMRANLSRPSFQDAWEHIGSRTDGTFEELRRLIDSSFVDDPKQWPR
jgi:hypothetical protein